MLTIRKAGSQILSKFFRSNSIKKQYLPGVKQELEFINMIKSHQESAQLQIQKNQPYLLINIHYYLKITNRLIWGDMQKHPGYLIKDQFILFVESNRLLRRSQHSSLLLQQDKKLQKIELGQVSCERFEIFAYDFFPVRDVTPTLLVLYISCREQRSHYLQVDYSKI